MTRGAMGRGPLVGGAAMPYEVVHAIGASVYAVLFVLFLWARSIPRTNPGTGWWAAALLLALAARLVNLILPALHIPAPAVPGYALLNVLENFCLVAGLVQFFNLRLSLRWVGFATLVVEAWVVLGWLGGASQALRGSLVVVDNVAVQLGMAWVLFRRRDEFAPRWLTLAAVAAVLLALHWALVFVTIARHPSWATNGFMLGMTLALTEYFALLAAVLHSFQKRLLLAEAEALDMAFHDPLTGLNNRRYMSSLFENALLLATRPHQLVAVLCLDLDDFKAINDRAGHRVGDELLKTAATRLKQTTRSTDICARLGGDEFVVICTQLEHAEQVHPIAQKLLDALAAPTDLAGCAHVIRASIGISFYPQHGRALSTLLEYADQAMYRAKHSGKHRYGIHPLVTGPDGAEAPPPGKK